MKILPIKQYAPKARDHFRDEIEERVAKFGITRKGISPLGYNKTTVTVGGNKHPASMASAIKELQQEFMYEEFDEVIERFAFIWFNRLIALRYLEVHKLISPRVLSATSSDNGYPEIINKLSEVHFFHSKQKIKLESLLKKGKSENEAYRTIIIAQCNELHLAMPFLFEEITPSLALVLPENLLEQGSIIRNLVDSIDEKLWLEGVEVIGWLYQYYISERKGRIIGKKISAEEIAPATQLFTPKWIVRYMVQNTLGSAWLEKHPSCALKAKWEYYCPQPKQNKTIVNSLSKFAFTDESPENLTVLDPACGSGHILVEAYDILKDMYIQAGYSPQDIPRRILKYNLCGLDIDERATQMASFALLMRACVDDPSLIKDTHSIVPQIFVIKKHQPKKILDAALVLIPKTKATFKIDKQITDLRFPEPHSHEIKSKDKDIFTKKSVTIKYSSLVELSHDFENGNVFGSLIKIPEERRENLRNLLHVCNYLAEYGTDETQEAACTLGCIAQQALALSGKFHCVLANPPYLGLKFQPELLKQYIKKNYKDFYMDLFSAFIKRNIDFCAEGGRLGFMTPMVWMFISSYSKLRNHIIDSTSITSLIRLNYGAFDGATVPIATFTLRNLPLPDLKGTYIDLKEFAGVDNQAPKVEEALAYPRCGWLYNKKGSDFKKIPKTPFCFWLNDNAIKSFSDASVLKEVAPARVGMQTSNNQRFLRRWHEVDYGDIDFSCESYTDLEKSGKKWFPYNKGGVFRKWFGNHNFIVNFENSGEEIIEYNKNLPRAGSFSINKETQLTSGVTWSDVSSSHFGARYLPSGFLSDVSGSGVFTSDKEMIPAICCFLCSNVASDFMHALNPTLHFQVGNVNSLPIYENKFKKHLKTFKGIFEQATEIMRDECSHREETFYFKKLPFCDNPKKETPLKDHIINFLSYRNKQRSLLSKIERKNDDIFSKIYGLESTSDLDSVNSNTNTYPVWDIEEAVKRLVSYAVGCILGRFSPTVKGILPKEVNDDKAFVAKSGFTRLINQNSEDEDLYSKFISFLSSTFGKKNLKNNLSFIASVLRTKEKDSEEQVIRSFLFKDFEKYHIKMYKKRPLYWVVSSGKGEVFKGIIYSHKISRFTLNYLKNTYLNPFIKDFSRLQKTTKNSNPTHLKELKQFAINLDQVIPFGDQDLDIGIVERYQLLGMILANTKVITSSASHGISRKRRGEKAKEAV